ncbi:MAG: FixH family protein [Phycicoccus sp.]
MTSYTGPAPRRMAPGRPRTTASARRVRAGVLAAVAAAVLALTACGATEPATVTGTAGALTVTLRVAQPSAGVQDAEVVVVDSGGAPVVDASVVAGATMPRMGHAGQVTTARALGDGRYVLEGDLFPMSGRWDVRVQVERDGSTTTRAEPTVVQPGDTNETVLPIVIR